MSVVGRNDLTSMISAIIKDNAAKSRTAQEEIFRKMILTDGYQDYFDAIIHLCFSLQYKYAYNAVFPPTMADLDIHAKRHREESAREDRAVDIAKSVIAARLLDCMMPNGKTLRQCTGAECIRVGGFFTKIGEKIGRDEIVGEAMTEADLQSLAKGSWEGFRPSASRRSAQSSAAPSPP